MHLVMVVCFALRVGGVSDRRPLSRKARRKAMGLKRGQAPPPHPGGLFHASPRAFGTDTAPAGLGSSPPAGLYDKVSGSVSFRSRSWACSRLCLCSLTSLLVCVAMWWFG